MYVVTYIDDINEEQCERFIINNDLSIRLSQLLSNPNICDSVNVWEFHMRTRKWHKAILEINQGPWSTEDYAYVTGTVKIRGSIITNFDYRLDGRAFGLR